MPLAVEAGEDRLGALAGAAVVHDDPVAPGGERAGGGGADPAGRAGDQDPATGVAHAGQRSPAREPGLAPRATTAPTCTPRPAGCLTVAG